MKQPRTGSQLMCVAMNASIQIADGVRLFLRRKDWEGILRKLKKRETLVLNGFESV